MEQTNYGSDTILIVDDEPRNLKLLNDLLQELVGASNKSLAAIIFHP